MKKKLFILISLGLMAFAACNKLENTEIRLKPAPAPETFNVSVPGAYTKTTLDGLKPKWVTGDEIRVYGHNTDEDTYTDNAVYELKSGNGEGTAVFSLKSGEEGLSGTYDEFYAVYPAGLTVTGLPESMILPRLNSSPYHLRKQNPSSGQIDPNLAVMTAKYNGSTMSFRHGVAYIKITIPSDGITAIDINLNNSTACLADTPTYNASTGALTSTGNSSKNIASATGTFEKGESYYFAAIPRGGSNHIGTTKITFTGGETVSTDHFSGKDVEIGKVFDLGTPALPTEPYFTANDVDINADATAGTIDFTVSNLEDGGVVTRSLVSSTIANLSLGAVTFNSSTGAGSVSFTCDENDDDEYDKTAVIRLTYTYGAPEETKTKDVTITQSKAGIVVLVPITTAKTWDVANNFNPLSVSKGTSALSETFIDDNLEYVCDSKIKFTSTYLRFDGTGSPTSKCVRFLIAGPGTLTVNAKSANSTATDRSVKIAHNGTADADAFTVPKGSDSAESHVWTISTASSGDVISVYSGNSGINVYSITWTPAS